MNLRKVSLHGGPADGFFSIVSHMAALSGGHLYVWDGGPDPDRFVHAPDLAKTLTAEQRIERARIDEWLERASSVDAIISLEPLNPEPQAWLMNLCLHIKRHDIAA